MKKKIVFLLAVVLAVALSLPRPAGAGDGLTLSPVIGRCVNGDGDIVCESKTNANVKVSYGAGATLKLEYVDQATSQEGSSALLEAPLLLKISKTLPTYHYPLRYLHTVPYQPYEEVRRIQNSSVGISSCIDSRTADNPSCGWTLDSVGNRIPDSQGFCSNRDLLDLKSCGDNPASWRGDEVLGENSSLVNSYSTAHCLRRGALFFAGFEIDTPRRDYKIDMVVTKEGTGTVLQNFSVSPQYPIVLDKTSDHAIMASLLGEARPPVAAPDLSGYILYIPDTPSSHPMVQQYWNNMLLVPRDMVTIDGSECNKVGASFTAFRKQGAVAPLSAAGDCLNNQLYQLHQEDLGKLAGNPEFETRFLTTGMKMFKGAASFDYLLLQLKANSPELNYSTIALEMDNAQVGHLANEASAWIKEATCSPFSSLSKEGTMKITVENVGTVPADYVVNLPNCYPGIQPIPPQARTLQPADIYIFNFDIMTSVNMEGEHWCWVTLQSPQTGREYDKLQVFFDTHPYVSITADQLQKQRKSKDSKKAN